MCMRLAMKRAVVFQALFLLLGHAIESVASLEALNQEVTILINNDLQGKQLNVMRGQPQQLYVYQKTRN
jgi:ABC-type enterochelin transport system permease subunit